MQKLTPSSINTTLTYENVSINIHVENDRKDSFRNQMIRGHLNNEILETITLTINDTTYNVPYSNNGMSVEDFMKHITFCMDMHDAFYNPVIPEEKS